MQLENTPCRSSSNNTHLDRWRRAECKSLIVSVYNLISTKKTTIREIRVWEWSDSLIEQWYIWRGAQSITKHRAVPIDATLMMYNCVTVTSLPRLSIAFICSEQTFPDVSLAYLQLAYRLYPSIWIHLMREIQ